MELVEQFFNKKLINNFHELIYNMPQLEPFVFYLNIRFEGVKIKLFYLFVRAARQRKLDAVEAARWRGVGRVDVCRDESWIESVPGHSSARPFKLLAKMTRAEWTFEWKFHGGNEGVGCYGFDPVAEHWMTRGFREDFRDTARWHWVHPFVKRVLVDTTIRTYR